MFENYFLTKLLFVYFCKYNKREKDPEINRTKTIDGTRHKVLCYYSYPQSPIEILE